MEEIGDAVNGFARRQLSMILDDLGSIFSPRQTRTSPSPTIVAVVTMTAPKTFDGEASMVTMTEIGGTAVAGGAVFATRPDAIPTSADWSDDDDSWSSETWPAATTAPSQTSWNSVSFATPAATISTPTADSDNLFASSSARASATPAQEESSGMSGGAKAGIAFGILIPLAALLVGALIFMRRKKQQKEAMERLDDEKSAMAKPDSLPAFPAPAPAPAPAPYQNQNGAAPQLNLRPLTQFDPRMSKLGGAPQTEGAMAAGAGAAVAAAAIGTAAAAHSSSSPRPSSSWERPGAERHANDPANPFGDHANNSAQNAAPAAVQPRASSPANIDVSDFPLPGSIAPSEKAISLRADPSTDNVSLAPANPAAASTLTLGSPNGGAPIAELAGTAVAGAAVAAGAGMMAADADKRNSPPPADNVYRVQLDFKPSMEDELEIRAGQLVRLLHAYDDGWALCIRMDRSQQGVVPRTCLSKNTVKPRQGPPQGPPQGRPGPAPGSRAAGSPQMRGPPAPLYGPQGRPMTPQGGRNSPAPFGQPGRPMTPQGRSMSPAPGRPMTPQGGRMSPAPGRARAQSNAAPIPYQPYGPGPQARSMSPGPYGPPGQMKPPARPDAASRRRSNSMGNITPPQLGQSPPGPSQLGPAPAMAPAPVPAPATPSKIPVRKPVPGMAV